ncbi:4Fe-4S binding protein [Geoglobus acetivorans]|uniref:Ferredoxin family protein n=1 Tax=Geoglobus acetivorans TaxID=565033 RepID=A0ABZ3H3U5_GEOAI|nr:4Fe-4S binding protein [Geoglobus acetivorans]
MIVFDLEKCIKCRKCERICPTLTIGFDEFPRLAYPEKCWHCCACIKECPAEAIRLRLPPHIGDQRYEMLVKDEGKSMIFQILFEGRKIDEMKIQVRK